MNSRRRRIISIAAAIAIAAGVAVAQLTEPAPSPAELFPAGALVYAEARDLNQLLTWWQQSDVKSKWEETSNYEQFHNSRLYQRLDERLAEFGKEHFTFSLENLQQFAGSRSALALYDIGELKAVAVTRVGFTEAAASELWAARSQLSKKKSGNQNYYIEPREGKLAFAYANPYLVLASGEALLLDVINAMQTPQTPDRITASEKWQQCARRNAPAGGLLTLFLDQENLSANKYFRNYWIHQNAEDLAPIKAAWVSLDVQDSAIVEQRLFIGTEDAAATEIPVAETAVSDYLKPFAAVHRENLQLQIAPASGSVTDSVLRLINRLPDGYREISAPPTYSAAAERISKAEQRSTYLEKIDEPVLKPSSDKLLQLDQPEKLQPLIDAAAPAALLRFRYPLWDNQALFVQFPESIAIQCNRFDALDQQQFLKLVLEYYRLLHATQDQGANWTPVTSGSYSLNSLNPLYVRFQSPWIVLSTRDQEFQQIVAALPASPVAPAASYTEIELDKARWKYSRLMRRLDTGAYEGDGPLFFSDNVDSLLQATDSIQRVSVLRSLNNEVIRYEIKKQ